MKKMTITALICAFVFCSIFTGCNTPAGNGKSSADENDNAGTDNTQQFVPDGIKDKKLSAFSPEEKAEIEKLYNYYWMDGVKDNCIKIEADRLVAYSTSMSFSYTNVRWAKVSGSWVCFSYHSDDFDYEPRDRKIILKFTEKAGAIELWQYVVPMTRKSGPFTKGKEVEEIKKDGKTYYVYDKTDNSSPKMLEPRPI